MCADVCVCGGGGVVGKAGVWLNAFFVKRTDAGVFGFCSFCLILFCFSFRVMCLLPVVSLACTFRYEPNKYVKDKYASVCLTLTAYCNTHTHLAQRERTGHGLWSVFTLGAGEQVAYIASLSILCVLSATLSHCLPLPTSKISLPVT